MESERNQRNGMIRFLKNKFFNYCYKNSKTLYKVIYDYYFRSELQHELLVIDYTKYDIEHILKIKKKSNSTVEWTSLKDVPLMENENELKDIYLEESIFKYFKFHTLLIQINFYHILFSSSIIPCLIIGYYFKRDLRKNIIKWIYGYAIFSMFLTGGIFTVFFIDSSTKPFLEKKFLEHLRIYDNLYEI